MLPSQQLREAVEREWISAGEFRILPDAIQPASIDLRLGDFAWALRCSFLPDVESPVEAKLDEIAFQRIDLRDGATLERDRPYLIPLVERLELPPHIRAKANPKSSTGRLDVFTRVITDRNHRFDEIQPGLPRGALPRGGAALVRDLRPPGPGAQPAASLQRRRHPRRRGAWSPCTSSSRCSTSTPTRCARPSSRSPAGSFSASTCSRARPIASSAIGRRRTACRSTSSAIRSYRWNDFWEPVFPEAGSRIVLEPEIFYLLLSAEGVCIPPAYAAEMMAYDPTAGELRTHYAGFFDPGFGFDPRNERHGSRAALEVRARDVPFMVEHRQPICKLALRAHGADPGRALRPDAGSNYQGQVTMLSKHFREQTAAAERPDRD